jgi:hypothetical protein
MHWVVVLSPSKDGTVVIPLTIVIWSGLVAEGKTEDLSIMNSGSSLCCAAVQCEHRWEARMANANAEMIYHSSSCVFVVSGRLWRGSLCGWDRSDLMQ